MHLAQLEFERTHLVNRWSHLERQKGSISTRGGPGEKQLELDKRYLEQKISAHKKSLAKVINKRSLSRRARQRSGKKMVALVGYTNAGKSTLFNQLTHSNAYADDQVFATLDPTIRRMHSSGESNILFSDTVGFIRDLPKGLLDAFKSTLEEINQACLILHVLDLSDPQHTYYEQVTADVLEKIGVTDIPCIKVYNKLDLVSGHTAFYADRTDRFSKNACWMTAQSPQDIQDLATLVEANVNGQKIIKTLHLNLTQAALKAYCYRCGWVKEAEAHDQGWKLTLELTQNQWRRILRRVIV